MLGLGLSLSKKPWSWIGYIKAGLKLFYPFKRETVSHASAGSTSFDGTNDYVVVSDDATMLDIFDDGGSIGGWIYPLSDGEANYGFIVTKELKYIVFVREESGGFVKIKFSYDFSTTDGGWVTTNAIVPINAWTHFAVTYDNGAVGNNPIIYLDGIPYTVGDGLTEASTPVGTRVTDSGDDVRIGNRSGNDRTWDGSIANVGIWDTALTQSQIQSIMYKSYADLSSSEKTNLVSWWGLDEDYLDAHGSNDGTNNGSTLTNSVYGGNAPIKPRISDSAPDAVKNYGTLHSGTCLSFDGTNDYVEAGESSDIITGTNVTYHLWIKNTDSDLAYPLQNQKAAGSSNLSFKINATAGELDLIIWDGSTHGFFNYDADINDSKWHNVVYTVTSSAQTLYFDGELVATSSYTFSNSASSDLFQIGRVGDDSNFFGGQLSSVKVFNSVLTEAQIQEMYLNPEQILPTGVSASNLKLHLPLQESTGSTAYDGSGNDNDGTIYGATWDMGNTVIPQTALIRSNVTAGVFYPEGLTSGQDIQGVSLANTDENVLTLNGAEYVEVSYSDSLDFGTDDFTIEFWLRKDNLSRKFIYNNRSSGADYLGIEWNSANKIVVDCVISNNTKISIINTNALSADTWYHITISIDRDSASGTKVYIDGIDDTSGTPTVSTDNINISANRDIGRWSGDGFYWDGKIDEARIYNRALTSAEVSKNYNAGLSKHS